MSTKSKSVLLSLVIGIVLMLSLAVSPAQAPIISPAVPYHSQNTMYYCGPACLEMVFDFYGPDISQAEIADAARTDGTWPSPYGTYTYEMRRAAHFSDQSTSAGELATHVTGYTARGLGYATFENSWTTIDQLKTLIDAGYPIIVLQWNALTHDWGHFRVVVGYDATTITVHDPLSSMFPPGPNNVYSYAEFNDLWGYSSRWALFASPWDVSISSPASVAEGNTFTVTATITYPRPAPFSAAYSASSSEATIQLPAGLSLAAGETAAKSLGTIPSGGSATVQWDVDAVSAGGPYSFTVEAEGQVTGSVSGHGAGVFTTGYTYTDRIGGSNTAETTVTPVVIPPYDVTIDAYCNTEAASVSAAITMDGNPTGLNTPNTFTGLTGSHTFTVPSADPSGHPFKEWSTGETTTTITVNSAGTYVAYYEAAAGPSVPEFGLSFSVVISFCAMLYLLIRKRQRIK